MIKVKVENFQSIESAEIEIDGLTVITGTNNAGKSAFFRAIRGAFSNTRGYDFVRQGKSHCRVSLEFEDGQTLVWKKGKGVNTYIVNGKELPKVGHGVPLEAQGFGVLPMRAGNAELWPQIAPQITGVSFLLHESGSVIAEAVADVERVNLLGKALKQCESDRRSTKSDLKIRKKDAALFSEKMEKFSGLSEAAQKAEILEQKRAKAEKTGKAHSNLVKISKRLVYAKKEVSSLEGIEKVGSYLPKVDGLNKARDLSETWQQSVTLKRRLLAAQKSCAKFERLQEVIDLLPSEDRVSYLQKFRKGLEVTVRLSAQYQEALEELRKIQAAQDSLRGFSLEESQVSSLERFKEALRMAKGLRERYRTQHKAVVELEGNVEALSQELESVQQKLTHLLGSYEECPVCGGTLDHVH